jgi:hypothetical protein
MAEPKFRRNRPKRAPQKERNKRYRALGPSTRMDDMREFQPAYKPRRIK